MRFGTALPCITPIGTPKWSNSQVVDGIEAVAKRADDLGYDWVTCCDHPVIPAESASFMGTRWFDPIATLGYAAGITTRVKLLTSVIILPYRSPFDIAKSMGTIDSLSGGRVIFGVGVGHLQREFEALKANYAERGAVTDEYIQVIKALWSTDVASYHGKYWDFTDMMVAPRPAQQPHPPFWVGGNTKLAVRRSALLGEAWYPFSITPEEYRVKADYAREVAAKAGRKTPLEMVAPLAPVEPAAVAPPTGPAAAPAYKAKPGEKVPYYVKASGTPVASPSLTTADQVCESIRRYRDAGATAVNVHFRYRELSPLLEALEWFAREVVPQFP